MSDDDLHALEKTLDVDYDDPFQELEACMEAAEFLKKIQSNKEKLVVLFTDSELTDADCKTLVTIIPKASNLEGISIDGVNISSTGSLLIDKLTKMERTNRRDRNRFDDCGFEETWKDKAFKVSRIIVLLKSLQLIYQFF
jgi:hypothetical protein